MVQFIGQLLLIPHGTLFGQIMFITTIIVSWAYNTFLSSIDRDELQMQIMFETLGLPLEDNSNIYRCQLDTFTATVAFVCFILTSVNPLKDSLVFLDAMVPNNTAVWKAWKEKISEKLKTRGPINFNYDTDLGGVDGESDREQLKKLLRDVEDAFDSWSKVRDSLLPPVTQEGPSTISL